MYTGSKVIIAVNRLFKAPVHPFNLQNDGIETYGEWQFERGKTTIEYFLKKYREEDMFKNKTVIDIGCGAAGKSIYYAQKKFTVWKYLKNTVNRRRNWRKRKDLRINLNLFAPTVRRFRFRMNLQIP